jgi:hypothetical protein
MPPHARERRRPPGELTPGPARAGPGGEDVQERNLMLRSDRLSSVVRDKGAHLARAGTELLGALRGRKRSLLYVGTALALAGAGTASAATVSSSASGPSAPTPRTVSSVAPTTARPAVGQQAAAPSWGQVRAEINQQTNPVLARRGVLPLADRLMPVAASGPQAWMPMSPAQLTNATTIVQQALSRRMGVRSAVIAVATSMQESQLLNLNYGDLDSLGLFQQRPSMGWGTAAQITNPAYASNVFLTALQQYQAGNPAWAAQPLWTSAQGVQKSGIPLAYAKWEAQAASLVKQIATRLR